MEVIIPIILALISYFTSKKAGASSAQAGLVAAGVGVGSYYVATQTDWGKSFFSDADAKMIPLMEGGVAVKDKDGNPVMVPEGSTTKRDGDKLSVTSPSGSVWTSTLDSVGGVLKSWGGTGTAAVIGAGAIATNSSLKKWLPWLLIGGVAIMVLK